MRLYTRPGRSTTWPPLLPSLVSRAPATCVCPGRTRILAASSLVLDTGGGLLGSSPASCWIRLPPAGHLEDSAPAESCQSMAWPSGYQALCHLSSMPLLSWKTEKLCWHPQFPLSGFSSGQESPRKARVGLGDRPGASQMQDLWKPASQLCTRPGHSLTVALAPSPILGFKTLVSKMRCSRR